MKNRILLILIAIIASFFIISDTAVAEETEKTLDETIEEMLQSVDTDALADLYKNLPNTLFSGGDIKKFLVDLLKGDTELNYKSVFGYALSEITSGIKEKMPLFITVFALLILSAVINAIKPEKFGKGVSEIVHFAIYSAIICSVTAIAYSMLKTGKDAIDYLSKTVQTVFPIVLALMSVTGSSSAVAFSPSVAFVSETAVIIAENVIFPLVVFMMVSVVVSNINKSVKLKGLCDFLSSSLKWIIGLIVAVFSVFLTVKGLTAGIYDGISLRAVKYALNSSVPIVGGLIKDGFDMILASAVLIKNSLGVFAIIVIFITALKPVLEIVVLSMCLKLINAVTEPLGNGRVSEFIRGICGTLNYIVATILMISLMNLILFVMIIFSSQAVL